MPPMTWDEVYQMYRITANATSERSHLKLVQKGVQGVLGADPWLSQRGAGREMRHLRVSRHGFAASLRSTTFN